MKCNQSRPEFELVSPCSFPTTITITPREPPKPTFLPLLSGPLWSEVTCMREIDLLINYSYSIGLREKNKKNLKKTKQLHSLVNIYIKWTWFSYLLAYNPRLTPSPGLVVKAWLFYVSWTEIIGCSQPLTRSRFELSLILHLARINSPKWPTFHSKLGRIIRFIPIPRVLALFEI